MWHIVHKPKNFWTYNNRKKENISILDLIKTYTLKAPERKSDTFVAPPSFASTVPRKPTRIYLRNHTSKKELDELISKSIQKETKLHFMSIKKSGGFILGFSIRKQTSETIREPRVSLTQSSMRFEPVGPKRQSGDGRLKDSMANLKTIKFPIITASSGKQTRNFRKQPNNTKRNPKQEYGW